MAIDMKEIIVQAARTLLLEKKVKKLTVKDIVEECQITRQAFYYHFEDISEMFQWVLEKETEHILQELHGREDAREGLRYLFLLGINVSPHVRKSMRTNYREEIERLLTKHTYRLFEQLTEEAGLYQQYSRSDYNLILRYHSQAITGILREWTEADTKNMDQIVNQVYLLLTGRVSPYPQS